MWIFLHGDNKKNEPWGDRGDVTNGDLLVVTSTIWFLFWMKIPAYKDMFQGDGETTKQYKHLPSGNLT